MKNNVAIEAVQAELKAGMQLAKCQQCGCMAGGLETLTQQLQGITEGEAAELAGKVAGWRAQMTPIRYACLGCEHCYPAVAESAFFKAFPEMALPPALTCGLQIVDGDWPRVLGEYSILDKSAPVAVVTLASVTLADGLADLKPSGLAIVGKLETENIGIDKVVKNVIANPAIRTIIVAGVEPKGHQSGSALLALVQNGVDEKNRVIGSTAKRPVLQNVSRAEIDVFRTQVQVVDLRGCEDTVEIKKRVADLALLTQLDSQSATACSCGGGCADEKDVSGENARSSLLPTLPLLEEPEMAGTCSDQRCSCHTEVHSSPEIAGAVDTDQPIPLDKAGYFVILPVTDRVVINVEHYSYDNTLLHVIEGPSARALYLAIIEQGWITEMSHAAYLGKELAKAELSLQYRFKYVQDGA